MKIWKVCTCKRNLTEDEVNLGYKSCTRCREYLDLFKEEVAKKKGNPKSLIF